MKAIDKLEAQLNKIGATLDRANADYTLNCDAPKGYVWRANGATNLAIHYATNQQTWLVEAIKEEMPALKMGLEKVVWPEEIKRIQWELGEDDWGAPEDAPMVIEWVGYLLR